MKMECVFCTQNCDNRDFATGIKHFGVEEKQRAEIRVKNNLIKTFLIFLERYLSSTNYKENKVHKLTSVKAVKELWKNILSSLLEGEVTFCDNCLKIVKSFCDLYHDLKTIQLLLDLQLSILNDTLKAAQANPPTSSIPPDKNPSVCEEDNKFDKLSEFRTWLSVRCSNKLRNSYPKLTLEKEVSTESPFRTSTLGEPEIPAYPSSPFESSIASEEYDNPSIDIELKCLNKASGHSDSKCNLLTGTEGEAKDASDTAASLNEQKNVKLEQIDGELLEEEAPEEDITHKVTETRVEPDISPLVPRTLRRVHKCFNCNKTFSNSEGLLSHLQECPFQDYEMGEDEGNEPVDAESDFECGDEVSESSDSSARESSPPLGTPPTTQMPLKKTLKEKKPTKREMSKGKIKVEKEEEKGKRLKCRFCSVSVSHHNSLRLREHIRLVHPEKWRKGQGLLDEEVHKYTHRFKCPTCEKLFKKLHFFQLHWRETHSNTVENLALNICIEIVAIPTNLESITQSEKIRSILVREKSKKYARIEIPLLGPEHELRICKVESCQRPFYSKEDLEIHSKLHGNFKCEKCPVEKDFLPDLSAHEISAHADQKTIIKCQRCTATFTEFLSYLRHHSSVHFSLDFNEQSCLICKSYLHKYECKGQLVKLFVHLKRGHDMDSELEESRGGGFYRCPEDRCSAYFMSLTGLNHHRRTQHHLKKEEIEEFKKARDVRVCEECGKKFKDQHLLDQHRIHHQGPESWSFCCEICSKKCSTRQKLDEHLRTHTKEKPFVCEVCGVKYAHRHNLRIHVKNKHGEETVGIKVTSKENAKKRKACEKSRKGSNRKKRTKRAISEEDTTESED